MGNPILYFSYDNNVLYSRTIILLLLSAIIEIVWNIRVTHIYVLLSRDDPDDSIDCFCLFFLPPLFGSIFFFFYVQAWVYHYYRTVAYFRDFAASETQFFSSPPAPTRILCKFSRPLKIKKKKLVRKSHHR